MVPSESPLCNNDSMTARLILFAALVSMAPLQLVIASERGESRNPPATALATKHTLAYIDSTNELIPPTLDGGVTEIEMGDVNNDGLIDLVSVGDHGSPLVGTDQHGVMVWLGNGDGTWTLEMSGHFGYGGIALGDVDGDGQIDVGYGIHHNYSATDFGDQLLEVALGDGSGRTWTPWDDGLASNGETWGMSATDFADVDGDGDLDLASVGFGCCAGVHVYLNQGDGSWEQSFGFLEGNARAFLVFGDINGDGVPDFAVSHEEATVYLGDGTGNFTPADGNLPTTGSRGRAGLSLGDIDRDGADDLAFCNPSGGIEVWTMDQPDVWRSLTGGLPTTGTCQTTQLADMDMDGRLDVTAFGSGRGEIWAGDGLDGWVLADTFSTPPIGDAQAFRIGGDLDHNGCPDIALIADEGAWPSLRSRFHVLYEASTPSTLTITAVDPLGRETIRAGSTVFIDWISAVPSSDPGRVDLELSTTGSAGPWQLIATDVPDNGRYQWIVPVDTPPTIDALIRFTLHVTGETVTTLTPAPFSIIERTAPNQTRSRHADVNRRRTPTDP